MDRRRFIKSGSIASGLALLPFARASANPAEDSAGWKRFGLTTQVDIAIEHGKTRIWLPIPRAVHGRFQKTIHSAWDGNFTRAALHTEPVYGAQMLYAEFDGKAGARLQLDSTVAVRDVAIDWKHPGKTPNDPEEVRRHLQSTPSSPTDGIILETARTIVSGQRTALGKAQAIYDWILDRGARNPTTKGCGTGDVIAMLESGDISGKCADLNGLFVALAKAAGVPARDVYGIRVGESKYFKSVGKSGDVTRAQHCRAEFYLAEFGWVPVDPADVLKVALEEKLPMDSSQIRAERVRQFGAWEGNWVAFNTARDVAMQPPAKAPLEFFMYPRAESEKGVLNPLDPVTFKYAIASMEMKA